MEEGCERTRIGCCLSKGHGRSWIAVDHQDRSDLLPIALIGSILKEDGKLTIVGIYEVLLNLGVVIVLVRVSGGSTRHHSHRDFL